MALVLFWGGMLVGVVGLVMDNMLVLGLGALVALCGVAIWKERR